MKINQKITEKELWDKGYIYLGEMGCDCKQHQATQIWKFKDYGEYIIWNPEYESIVWREYDELHL